MSRKKKRKGSGFFSNLLLLLCIVVFCVAAWKLWGYYNNYHGGRKEYEQLRQYVKEKKDSDKKKKKKSGPDTCPVQVDFDALARINPDVKAWIYIKELVLIIRLSRQRTILPIFTEPLKERIVLLELSF